MSAPSFSVGDRVFLASAGLGKVLDFAARDAQGNPVPVTPPRVPEFYVVAVGDTVACVPFSRAETLRPPVSREQAARMLEALRAEVAPASPPQPLLERGKSVVHSGTPLEHAQFLRELYALRVPVAESLASGVTFLGKLVLPELAFVLGLDAAALEAEMRRRYPAAQDAHEQQALLRFHPT